ncbi:hypothetical protein Q5752_005494 [Cryptotrichosporon argae]
MATSPTPPQPRAVVTTVFLSLLVDLLAFTMPLPLFPRMIAWYTASESADPNTLLARLLGAANRWRALVSSSAGEGYRVTNGASEKKWDVVLLGGAMGSLFSLCQCFISPWIGSLSDRFGRKKVLLATMVGNIASAVIWLYSTSFSTYLLSRTVGGLSEGNVQLSTAIISDVTTASTRSKSLALVGIAFSVCFTLGPSLGAYFASRSPPALAGYNIYAVPALITLVLLILETVYLAAKLPETRWTPKAKDAAEKKRAAESAETRLRRLRALGRIHGLFLLFFSGAEFTLTFLTYDLFAATNAENGRLLSYIGVLSAVLQARHVRPALARGELRVARRGIASCVLGLGLLAVLPTAAVRDTAPTAILYAAATALAYTSATVVTGLTAAAAACCDEEDDKGNERLRRGRALGGFRSRGQLGRAIGPLLATSIYWFKGPTVAYSTVATALATVYAFSQSIA